MRGTIVDALGWALIHSLWQCAALAVLFAALNLVLRRASANLRYVLGYSTLLAMPAAAIATFVSLLQHHEIAVAIIPASMPVLGRFATAAPVISSTPAAMDASNPLPYLSLVVWFWLTGVIAMSAWSTAGWLVAQRVKRRARWRFRKSGNRGSRFWPENSAFAGRYGCANPRSLKCPPSSDGFGR